MWDSLRNYVRVWDWRLFLFILMFLGLPNLYQLYRVRLIGNELPDPGSLAIVFRWSSTLQGRSVRSARGVSETANATRFTGQSTSPAVLCSRRD